MAAPCVEHVAVRVRDFEAALAFFTDVMGMEITLTDPASANRLWIRHGLAAFNFSEMKRAAATTRAMFPTLVWLPTTWTLFWKRCMPSVA